MMTTDQVLSSLFELGAYGVQIEKVSKVRTHAPGFEVEYVVNANVWRVWKPDGDGKELTFTGRSGDRAFALRQVLRNLEEHIELAQRECAS